MFGTRLIMSIIVSTDAAQGSTLTASHHRDPSLSYVLEAHEKRQQNGWCWVQRNLTGTYVAVCKKKPGSSEIDLPDGQWPKPYRRSITEVIKEKSVSWSLECLNETANNIYLELDRWAQRGESLWGNILYIDNKMLNYKQSISISI